VSPVGTAVATSSSATCTGSLEEVVVVDDAYLWTDRDVDLPMVRVASGLGRRRDMEDMLVSESRILIRLSLSLQDRCRIISLEDVIVQSPLPLKSGRDRRHSSGQLIIHVNTPSIYYNLGLGD